MIKERLKEIELRITELSEYISISRPTMYKFIEAYDEGNKSILNSRVLKLFNYIEENPLAGRRAVMTFILSNLTEKTSNEGNCKSEEFSCVTKYISENPDSPKTQFFQLAAKKTDFDDVIKYLLKIHPFLRERRLSEEQIALLKPYDDIREIIENQTEEN